MSLILPTETEETFTPKPELWYGGIRPFLIINIESKGARVKDGELVIDNQKCKFMISLLNKLEFLVDKNVTTYDVLLDFKNGIGEKANYEVTKSETSNIVYNNINEEKMFDVMYHIMRDKIYRFVNFKYSYIPSFDLPDDIGRWVKTSLMGLYENVNGYYMDEFINQMKSQHIDVSAGYENLGDKGIVHALNGEYAPGFNFTLSDKTYNVEYDVKYGLFLMPLLQTRVNDAVFPVLLTGKDGIQHNYPDWVNGFLNNFFNTKEELTDRVIVNQRIVPDVILNQIIDIDTFVKLMEDYKYMICPDQINADFLNIQLTDPMGVRDNEIDSMF